jgi:hypothetical protein
MPPPLELNCLVLGQDRSHVFRVSLPQTRYIEDLKKGIREKKKPEFDHVPADTLVIWRVSVRINSNLKRDVESLNLVKEGSLYSPIDELGGIFSPEPGHLHVVVQPLPGE